MKKILTCLLATWGLTTACGQENYENIDVKDFAALTANPDVVVLDVRTAEEFSEQHLQNALNIDVKRSDFLSVARALLPKDMTVAVYCRSGRRSANAAAMLAGEGYKAVNMAGGIMAWNKADMPVTTDTHEVDVFRTRGQKTVRFHALMHASIRMEVDGKEIQIDPVLKLRDRTVDYAAMPKAHYILVTHEHGDHFDRQAISQLTEAGTQLITNKRCADIMGYGTVMANGDTLTTRDGISLQAVPAYNTTEGHRQFHPKGRDNGFIITVDGLRIYIAGDTEDIPEMAGISNVDIAFMPCNQPYTMTPQQLIQAARTVKPRVLFPYHYGDTDLSQVAGQLRAEGIDVRIRRSYP